MSNSYILNRICFTLFKLQATFCLLYEVAVYCRFKIMVWYIRQYWFFTIWNSEKDLVTLIITSLKVLRCILCVRKLKRKLWVIQNNIHFKIKKSILWMLLRNVHLKLIFSRLMSIVRFSLLRETISQAVVRKGHFLKVTIKFYY